MNAKMLQHHLTSPDQTHWIGILSDDPKVDISGLAIGERASHSWHEPSRAQADVLIKFPPELQQAAPEGDMVRDKIRHSDGTEADCIEVKASLAIVDGLNWAQKTISRSMTDIVASPCQLV
jgi:hypothetical protein